LAGTVVFAEEDGMRIGVGLPFKDHAAVGMDFENRFKTFHANMGTIRRLMAGETVGAASTGAMKPTGDTA
jgi:hypothetical protein